jgi:D-xylono/L-arabinono-1,4-lactonase
MMELSIDPLSNQHCNTGENPYWHPDDGRVYWTDIPNGVLYRYDPTTRSTETIYRGDPVGGFTLQADGRLLLFRVRDVATLDIRTFNVERLFEYSDPTMQRFNDVHADPLGRVFAGTIGTADDNGGLYLVDLDHGVKKVAVGSRVSNGMAFSFDESTLFWTDTGNRTIFAFDYDRESGSLSNRRVHYRCPDEEHWPDGMAMDRDGNLWSTRWDGGRIVVISPDGTKREEIRLPVGKVSCCFFGGAGGDELFVTTAGGKIDSHTADGTLYRIRTHTTGRPRFRSRL